MNCPHHKHLTRGSGDCVECELDRVRGERDRAVGLLRRFEDEEGFHTSDDLRLANRALLAEIGGGE